MKKDLKRFLARKVKPHLISFLSVFLNQNSVISFACLLFVLKFRKLTTINWQPEIYANRYIFSGSKDVGSFMEGLFRSKILKSIFLKELNYIGAIVTGEIKKINPNLDFDSISAALNANFVSPLANNESICDDYDVFLSSIEKKLGPYNNAVIKKRTARPKKYKILYFCDYLFFDEYNPLDSIKLHDKSKFDVSVFQNKKICKAAKSSKFHILNSFEKLKEKEFDIVVDCNGYMTPDKSLFALRKRIGRLQVAAFNDLIPIKLPNIDYIMSYDYLTEGLDQKYFISLSDQTIIPTMPKSRVFLPKTLPCEKNGFITFGNSSSPSRINYQTVKTWSNSLKLSGKSVMKLIHYHYVHKAYVNLILNMFKVFKISPDRIIFETIQGYPNYLEGLCDVDIILSAYPLAGGRTLTQTLSEGLFSVNLEKSDNVYSKLSGLFASALDLEKYTTHKASTFVDICADLMDNPKQIIEVRQQTREKVRNFNNDSPEYFVREFESKLLKLLDD